MKPPKAMFYLTWTGLPLGLVGSAFVNFSKSAGQPFNYGGKYADFLNQLQTLILRRAGLRPLNAGQRHLFTTWAASLWAAAQACKSKESIQDSVTITMNCEGLKLSGCVLAARSRARKTGGLRKSRRPLRPPVIRPGQDWD